MRGTTSSTGWLQQAKSCARATVKTGLGTAAVLQAYLTTFIAQKKQEGQHFPQEMIQMEKTYVAKNIFRKPSVVNTCLQSQHLGY
jgi:hypothetical protein